MKIAETDILLVPGLGNSGPGHWQRRWLEKMPTAQWVEQDDWDNPELDQWSAKLRRAIMMATRPVVLVGHSLGVHLIVHTAQNLADTKVRGAFLVSPPDLDTVGNDYPQIRGFTPIPTAPLPFPSLLVGSTNDDYCSAGQAGEFANCWGSDFHLANDSGHINLASGHGPWPDGLMMFARLMKRLKA